MNTPRQSRTPVPTAEIFDEMIAKVTAGDEVAVQTLLDTYGPHIVRVVRRRMNARIRERFDSQDFAQAVWASFFEHRSQIVRFQKSEDLIQFLSRVAANKVIDAGRRVQVRNEQHSDSKSDSNEPARDLRLRISEPTPSQHAVARESWDIILADEEETSRQVVEMRIEGLTQQQIALALGVSERSVRRTLTRISRKVFTDEN